MASSRKDLQYQKMSKWRCPIKIVHGRRPFLETGLLVFSFAVSRERRLLFQDQFPSKWLP